uniref:Uncharacterized protein n=1 Tax=Rhodnius prolixus TaxID=13249 RepID=T1HHP8_RHOPR
MTKIIKTVFGIDEVGLPNIELDNQELPPIFQYRIVNEKIHPHNDRTGFRKYYERTKDSPKTTYKEHFNGEGAYFPPLSTYVKAVNDLADIVEKNEDEIKKQFSVEMKHKAERQRDFMIDRKVDILKSFSENKNKDKDLKNFKESGSYFYTPLDLSSYHTEEPINSSYPKYRSQNIFTPAKSPQQIQRTFLSNYTVKMNRQDSIPPT